MTRTVLNLVTDEDYEILEFDHVKIGNDYYKMTPILGSCGLMGLAPCLPRCDFDDFDLQEQCEEIYSEE